MWRDATATAASCAVTEGGYDLGALEACLEASIAVLDGGGDRRAARAVTRPPPVACARRDRRRARGPGEYWKL